MAAGKSGAKGAPATGSRRMRGFERAASLVETRIRKAGESRGFAVTRLLTHWAEIVGTEIAATARPLKVSYAQGGFGGTLTILTTGAHAPILAMQADRIRERVNACYGFAAISHVRITQTAPTGFAEGQAAFGPAPAPAPVTPPAPTPEVVEAVAPVGDPALRAALAALGANVHARPKR